MDLDGKVVNGAIEPQSLESPVQSNLFNRGAYETAPHPALALYP